MEEVKLKTSVKELIDANENAFREQYGRESEITVSAPGRINIIGEHTDYNFGLCMPAAINRWVLISLSKRKDNNISIKSLNYNSELSFSIDTIPELTINWQKYIYGAFSVFKEKIEITSGFDALIWGNVPLGSGVSSSAALEVAMMNGLRSLYEVNLDDLQLVKLCQQVEHQFLNVKSGLLDQYASQFSREGMVMVLDLYALKHQYVNWESDQLSWVLVDSGINRELGHSGYSQRVKETSDAFDYLKKNKASIKNFRDIKENDLDLLTEKIWQKRIKHYLSENKRVIDAMDFIQNNDFAALGKIMNFSHESLRDLYEVSCKELDFLAETAKIFPHCLGSRMMGGGFGGCTLNLVKTNALGEFTGFIKENYLSTFNQNPNVNNFKLVHGAAVHKK